MNCLPDDFLWQLLASESDIISFHLRVIKCTEWRLCCLLGYIYCQVRMVKSIYLASYLHSAVSAAYEVWTNPNVEPQGICLSEFILLANTKSLQLPSGDAVPLEREGGTAFLCKSHPTVLISNLTIFFSQFLCHHLFCF